MWGYLFFYSDEKLVVFIHKQQVTRTPVITIKVSPTRSLKIHKTNMSKTLCLSEEKGVMFEQWINHCIKIVSNCSKNRLAVEYKFISP